MPNTKVNCCSYSCSYTPSTYRGPFYLTHHPPSAGKAGTHRRSNLTVLTATRSTPPGRNVQWRRDQREKKRDMTVSANAYWPSVPHVKPGLPTAQVDSGRECVKNTPSGVW